MAMALHVYEGHVMWWSQRRDACLEPCAATGLLNLRRKDFSCCNKVIFSRAWTVATAAREVAGGRSSSREIQTLSRRTLCGAQHFEICFFPVRSAALRWVDYFNGDCKHDNQNCPGWQAAPGPAAKSIRGTVNELFSHDIPHTWYIL